MSTRKARVEKKGIEGSGKKDLGVSGRFAEGGGCRSVRNHCNVNVIIKER
jgi:hypothetical protein